MAISRRDYRKNVADILGLLSRIEPLRFSDRNGEGFRMPFGVRKPPKHEPAGLRQLSMGISAFGRAR
jgi:hypothetical protein